MNRRGFLAGLGALVGGITIEKAIPFGRVWSFPREIRSLNTATITATILQYADYVSFCDLSLATEIDPHFLNEMAYRAGRSIDAYLEMA